MPDLFRFPFRRAVNFTGSFKVPGSTAALAIQEDMLLEVAALALSGVQILATGLAAEAETAFARQRRQIWATGLASGTDSTISLAGVQIRPAGLGEEVGAALTLNALQRGSTGTANEADAALNLSSRSTRAIGLSVEVGAAFARPVGALTVGRAVEIDIALPLGTARQVGIAGSFEYAIIPSWTVAAAPAAQNIASGFLHPFMKKMAA